MAAKIKDFFQKMTIFKFLDKMDIFGLFSFFPEKNFSDKTFAHNLIKKVV